MADKPLDTGDLDAKPVRRTFTPEFKARILAEYDAAPSAAERGAILRRERLYGSHILDWRKARDAGAAAGLVDRRQSAQRATKSTESAELARLRRCCPALKMSTKPALLVRMCGCEKTPLAVAGRGLGVQVAGLVFSLQ